MYLIKIYISKFAKIRAIFNYFYLNNKKQNCNLNIFCLKFFL